MGTACLKAPRNPHESWRLPGSPATSKAVSGGPHRVTIRPDSHDVDDATQSRTDVPTPPLRYVQGQPQDSVPGRIVTGVGQREHIDATTVQDADDPQTGRSHQAVPAEPRLSRRDRLAVRTTPLS